ncbi:thioesterase II family protein [Clostridium paraputrificum]|uniref:thioesterase II family protein n=1 Tax=Clostridium TaxID=1485 RepID=UPI003D33BAD8
MILFCLPYAGGSEGIYFNWREYLDDSIKLLPIPLKGRGKRFYEDFYENWNEAVEDIFNIIKEEANEDEYAVFGHSMGSLLAYELYYKIKSSNWHEPMHIFFSGHGAPNIIKNKKPIHILPDREFMDKVIELGGTPKEVYENKELLDIFIPVLRNDFKLISNFTYINREERIKCNVSILNGKEDSITENEIFGWKTLINDEVNIYNFNGDHFFINDNIENIVKIINDTLLK